MTPKENAQFIKDLLHDEYHTVIRLLISYQGTDKKLPCPQTSELGQRILANLEQFTADLLRENRYHNISKIMEGTMKSGMDSLTLLPWLGEAIKQMQKKRSSLRQDFLKKYGENWKAPVLEFVRQRRQASDQAVANQIIDTLNDLENILK